MSTEHDFLSDQIDHTLDIDMHHDGVSPDQEQPADNVPMEEIEQLATEFSTI